MESIEAKAPDQDVEMEDRQDDADADADVDADAGADGEVDADGEPDEEPDGRRSRDQTDMLNTMSKIESFLRNFVEEWVASRPYLSAQTGLLTLRNVVARISARPSSACLTAACFPTTSRSSRSPSPSATSGYVVASTLEMARLPAANMLCAA